MPLSFLYIIHFSFETYLLKNERLCSCLSPFARQVHVIAFAEVLNTSLINGRVEVIYSPQPDRSCTGLDIVRLRKFLIEKNCIHINSRFVAHRADDFRYFYLFHFYLLVIFSQQLSYGESSGAHIFDYFDFLGRPMLVHSAHAAFQVRSACSIDIL